MTMKSKSILILLVILSHFSGCSDKKKALPLKIIAPDRNVFVVVKVFAAGIILSTGFMHVLPDSFEMLSSECLKDNPWHNFLFTEFFAMLSAIVTLMIDSLATSFYTKKHQEAMSHVAAAVDMDISDDSISKKTGSTCMNPVARIVLAANPFTTTK